MAENSREVGIFIPGTVVYLVKKPRRHPLGHMEDEIQDILLIKHVLRPHRCRGLLLGTRTMCTLTHGRNKHGEFHIARRSLCGVHYDVMTPIKRWETLEFIESNRARLEEQARSAARLLEKFYREALRFTVAMNT